MYKVEIKDLFIKYPTTLFTIGELQHLSAEENTRKLTKELVQLSKSDFPLVKTRIQRVSHYGLIGAYISFQGVNEGDKVNSIVESRYDSLWSHQNVKSPKKGTLRYRRRKLLMHRINSRLGELKLPKSCYYPHGSIL